MANAPVLRRRKCRDRVWHALRVTKKCRSIERIAEQTGEGVGFRATYVNARLSDAT